jgi:hypothetical protein
MVPELSTVVSIYVSDTIACTATFFQQMNEVDQSSLVVTNLIMDTHFSILIRRIRVLIWLLVMGQSGH